MSQNKEVYMSTIDDARLFRMRELIKQHSPVEIARRLGYDKSAFISQMAGPNPTRKISEKTARAVEQAFGLPRGWMDTGAGVAEAVAPYAPRRPAPAASPAAPLSESLLTDVMTLVQSTAAARNAHLAPAQLAKITTHVYKSSVEEGHALSKEHVERLIDIVL